MLRFELKPGSLKALGSLSQENYFLGLLMLDLLQPIAFLPDPHPPIIVLVYLQANILTADIHSVCKFTLQSNFFPFSLYLLGNSAYRL